MGDPVVKRANEMEERPQALAELGRSIQMVRKALDEYAQQVSGPPT